MFVKAFGKMMDPACGLVALSIGHVNWNAPCQYERIFFHERFAAVYKASE